METAPCSQSPGGKISKCYQWMGAELIIMNAETFSAWVLRLSTKRRAIKVLHHIVLSLYKGRPIANVIMFWEPLLPMSVYINYLGGKSTDIFMSGVL